MKGLEALEVAILLSISLAIIFAAVPYIVQTIFQTEASLEAKNVLAFLASLADSLEMDFGMTGVQRMYQLPSAYFGTFYVRTPRYLLTVDCGPKYTYVFHGAVVGYNSTYAVFGDAMARGLRGSLIVPLGEPLTAVNTTYPGAVRMYSRVVYVNASDLYLYTISASFTQQGTGGLLAYAIGPSKTIVIKCGGPARISLSSSIGSSTASFSGVNRVYIVYNNVTFVWK